MPDYNVSEMPQYPGTNFHDLNLDWLLSEMKNSVRNGKNGKRSMRR